MLAGTLRALEPPHLYITVDQPLPVAARCRIMPLPTSPTAPLLELCGTVIDDDGGVLLDDCLEQDIEALRRALAAT